MKRFLNHNRYKLSDQERENIWYTIRRELNPDGRSRWISMRAWRPALAGVATVATLAMLGVWWIGSNQMSKIGTVHPGLLAEAPDNRIPEVDLIGKKAPGTEALDDLDVAAIEPKVAKAPGEGLEKPPVEESPALELAASPESAPAAGIIESETAVREHILGSKTYDKHAIDLVEEARSKKAGVVMRAGELNVRGDPPGNVSRQIGALAPPSANAEKAHKPAQWNLEKGLGYGGSVTGGIRPPNGEQVELMYFEHTGVNPFVATEEDSLSTFAVDVDNASWTIARNYLDRGMLPPKDAIRVEEFVNTFDPGWARHSDEVFRIHSDGTVSRFGKGHHLLRVGVVGKTVKDEDRKAANLIFVIDISGSMNRENRLGAVKKSLHILLDELGEGDRVGLVVYGSRGEIRLEPTDISRREVIMQAIDGLVSNGSTNVHEGLELAYGLARKFYEPTQINRLILCSDGVANNGGSTEAEEILSMVRKASDEGITISTIGFGMGNYNDVLMEKLADKGDGNYYYVDRQEEAERVFKENLTGLLQTIAREVKVQVEFDTRVVKRWRLLGYENRDVADRDFRNDAVDAGEVGSGHQVTALYELKLAHPPGGPEGDSTRRVEREGPAIRVGTVRLRYEAPAHDTARSGQVEEIEQTLLLNQLAGDFASGTVGMRAQAIAAEFAEILRGSYWAKESRLADLVPAAYGLVAEMPDDPLIRDLADMIRKAADLQAAGSNPPEVEVSDPHRNED